METFKIVKIIPIGFKKYIYSNNDCPLCRELLNDSKESDITKDNNLYYHNECLKIIKNNKK